MDEQKNRREQVLAMIANSTSPLSATKIATTLGVSRQIIVGDVALLRAEGHMIIATARGYIMEIKTNEQMYRRKIACIHLPFETADELYLLVDHGLTVVDVIVDHSVYGELTGSLNLKTRIDVDNFIKRLEASDVKLLSVLTGGVHLHTVTCENEETFTQAMTAMKAAGFLLE